MGPSPLRNLPELELLELYSGWWLFDDFRDVSGNDLPRLLSCILRFKGSAHSFSGWYNRYRGIFNHRRLEYLKIVNETDGLADGWTSWNSGLADGSTNLGHLSVKGIGISSLSPALQHLIRMRRLCIKYTQPITKGFSQDLNPATTDEITERVFRQIFSSLEHLKFHHKHLGSFAWARFTQPTILRVHADNNFPSDVDKSGATFAFTMLSHAVSRLS